MILTVNFTISVSSVFYLIHCYKKISMLHFELTGKIIKAFYKVNNYLGFGFLEKVYENSLKIELTRMNLKVEQQKNIRVFYNGTMWEIILQI